MILVIGGLMLLTILILSFYKGNSSHISTAADNEAIIVGSSIGASLIEEITLKKFDHKVTAGKITPVDSLTLSGSLGPETGEYSVNLFNDIDDFDDYIRIDTLSNLGVFDVIVNVYYVDISNPDDSVSTRKYHKRINVNVDNDDYLITPINLYHIVSY